MVRPLAAAGIRRPLASGSGPADPIRSSRRGFRPGWTTSGERKQKNVPADRQGQFGYGDVWTWTAIGADTKLVPSWRIGPRDLRTAYDFMDDLADRLSNRVQLTTDGLKVYLEAVESAFNLYYNFVKIHQTLRTTPAQAAGVTVRLWEISDLVALLDV